jgi:type II secretory pathway pseudopilin PulG
MRDTKNRNDHSPGFTFVEILLALTILAGSMYIFSGIQFRAVNKVRKSVNEVERVFFIKKELYKLFLDTNNKKPKKITIAQPEIVIETSRRKIDPKKSALKDFEKEIDIIVATGNWKDGPDQRSMSMISFIEKPKPKKKQEKKVAKKS